MLGRKAVINSAMSAPVSLAAKTIFEIGRLPCLDQIEELCISSSYRSKKCVTS